MVAVLHIFSLPCHIPLCEYSALFFIVLLLMDTWVVFIFFSFSFLFLLTVLLEHSCPRLLVQMCKSFSKVIGILGLIYSEIYFLPFCWPACVGGGRLLQAVCFRLLCQLGLVRGRRGVRLEGTRKRGHVFLPLFLSCIAFLEVTVAVSSWL